MSFTKNVQVASIDECYVDATELTKRYRPIEIALMIQNKIFEVTGLSSSVGISTNILLSKMASNLDKPKGISTLYVHEIETKLWPMPIGEMYMIGQKTSEKLISFGINTIGDLAKLKNNQELYNKIKDEIGINLDKHIDASNGIYTNVIEVESDQLKSISKSKTFPNPIDDIDLLTTEIRELFDFALYRCKKRKIAPSSISLSFKLKKTLNAYSVSKSTPVPTTNTEILWPIVLGFIDKLYKRNDTIRYASISFDGLKAEEKIFTQLTLDGAGANGKSKLQILAEQISFEQGIEVVTGTTMKDNIKYEDKEPVMRDNVRFKRWDK